MRMRSLRHSRVAVLLLTKSASGFARPKPHQTRLNTALEANSGDMGMAGIITAGLLLHIRMKYKDELKESAPNLQLPNTLLSRSPVDMIVCPNCSETHIRTRTRTYPVRLTWICIAIGYVGFTPFCWIPMVVDRFKQTDHYCQRCGEKVGEIGPLRDFFVTEGV